MDNGSLPICYQGPCFNTSDGMITESNLSAAGVPFKRDGERLVVTKEWGRLPKGYLFHRLDDERGLE